jgi:hypothetical protein
MQVSRCYPEVWCSGSGDLPDGRLVRTEKSEASGSLPLRSRQNCEIFFAFLQFSKKFRFDPISIFLNFNFELWDIFAFLQVSKKIGLDPIPISFSFNFELWDIFAFLQYTLV